MPAETVVEWTKDWGRPRPEEVQTEPTREAGRNAGRKAAPRNAACSAAKRPQRSTPAPRGAWRSDDGGRSGRCKRPGQESEHCIHGSAGLQAGANRRPRGATAPTNRRPSQPRPGVAPDVPSRGTALGRRVRDQPASNRRPALHRTSWPPSAVLPAAIAAVNRGERLCRDARVSPRTRG